MPSPASGCRHARRPASPGDADADVPALPPGIDGVTREAAEEAVRTLLRWAGEDPAREGLLDTPKRVVKAYRDWFSGYALGSARIPARAPSRKSPATTN